MGGGPPRQPPLPFPGWENEPPIVSSRTVLALPSSGEVRVRACIQHTPHATPSGFATNPRLFSSIGKFVQKKGQFWGNILSTNHLCQPTPIPTPLRPPKRTFYAPTRKMHAWTWQQAHPRPTRRKKSIFGRSSPPLLTNFSIEEKRLGVECLPIHKPPLRRGGP